MKTVVERNIGPWLFAVTVRWGGAGFNEFKLTRTKSYICVIKS